MTVDGTLLLLHVVNIIVVLGVVLRRSVMIMDCAIIIRFAILQILKHAIHMNVAFGMIL